jgi:DNA replication protein DnaC
VAQALGHTVARRGGEVRFAKASRVLADLAGGHADRTWGARIRDYTRPAVLILDDFAMREHTAAQADDLYELISERAILHRPLILTSNRRPIKAHMFAGTCAWWCRNITGSGRRPAGGSGRCGRRGS